MPDDDELERKKQKFLANKYEPLINYAKKLLFEKVNNVIISNRLTDEPCVVVADSYGHSSFMDKIQKAQMFAGAQDNPLSDFKKIMEINPHHKVNQIILEKINVFFLIKLEQWNRRITRTIDRTDVRDSSLPLRFQSQG